MEILIGYVFNENGVNIQIYNDLPCFHRVISDKNFF